LSADLLAANIVRSPAACVGQLAPSTAAFKAQSLGWLIERYRESTACTTLSPATRRRRERILLAATNTAGKTLHRRSIATS
jgi:hypothetical protein